MRDKGRLNWALKLVQEAVNTAPSEFVMEVEVELGLFKSALLMLNSWPTFTFNGRDAHRPLMPTRGLLPFRHSIGEILNSCKTEDDTKKDADQWLSSLGSFPITDRTLIFSHVTWSNLRSLANMTALNFCTRTAPTAPNIGGQSTLDSMTINSPLTLRREVEIPAKRAATSLFGSEADTFQNQTLLALAVILTIHWLFLVAFPTSFFSISPLKSLQFISLPPRCRFVLNNI
ncbi:hypothetical protein K438DRAFT_1785613 [Mycena galopus ATCC 62051]|nr:hypothetical protein K438DRAFT_1785613 [Mycena galopus ATCC 62051]